MMGAGHAGRHMADHGRVAAFFDMDRTVVLCNTGRVYMRDLRARGEIGLIRMLQVSAVLLRYKLSMIDMNRVMKEAAVGLRGQSEDDMSTRCERLFERDVRPLVSTAAVDAIGSHRRLGHRVVMLTASSQYMVRPLCKHLGIDDYLCTRLTTDRGVFTGECVQPLCYGEGKIFWARDYADRHGIDLSKSYFYTDSYSDLPMLRTVGHRRVVNPDPRLRIHAIRERWPVLSFQR